MKRLQKFGTDFFLKRGAARTAYSATIVRHFGELLMSIKVIRHALIKLSCVL